MTRVILDTNLWISYFLRSGNSPLNRLIEHEQLIFLWSEELIEELIQVSQRDKFRKHIPLDQLTFFLGYLQSKSELVEVKSELNQITNNGLNIKNIFKNDYRIPCIIFFSTGVISSSRAATPRPAPVYRQMLGSADATPMRSRGTSEIAVVVTALVAAAWPTPSATIPGRIHQ